MQHKQLLSMSARNLVANQFSVLSKTLNFTMWSSILKTHCMGLQDAMWETWYTSIANEITFKTHSGRIKLKQDGTGWQRSCVEIPTTVLEPSRVGEHNEFSRKRVKDFFAKYLALLFDEKGNRLVPNTNICLGLTRRKLSLLLSADLKIYSVKRENMPLVY